LCMLQPYIKTVLIALPGGVCTIGSSKKPFCTFFVFWVSGQMDHQDTLGITI